MSLFEDYVQFEAQLYSFYIDENQIRQRNETTLPMVPCSADQFFEPKGTLRDAILHSMPYI